jgi:hypothetical protein
MERDETLPVPDELESSSLHCRTMPSILDRWRHAKFFLDSEIPPNVWSMPDDFLIRSYTHKK